MREYFKKVYGNKENVFLVHILGKPKRLMFFPNKFYRNVVR